MKCKSRSTFMLGTLTAFLFSQGLFSIFLFKSSPKVCSLLFFLSSLLFGLLSMRCLLQLGELTRLPKKPFRLLSTLIALTGILTTSLLLNDLFTNTLNSKPTSDVILLVELMIERFLSGEFVYAPTSDWKYTITPTYLPAIWMPFLVAEILSFDYRWIPYSILATSLCILQYRIYRWEDQSWALALLSSLPWIVWIIIILKLPNIFVVSIESINIGYYLLLGLAVLWKNPKLIGAAIALCLMSRFSFVLWLPLLGISYFVKNKKDLFIILGTSVVLVLLIYVIPFLSSDISSLIESIKSYSKAAIGEWSREDGKLGRPYHLFRGQGMASFFYETIDGNLENRLRLLQLSHLLLSLGSVLFSFFFFLKNKRNLDIGLFLMSSLVIYFSFFYHFIQVPYSYLFLVSLFVSILLWTELILRRKLN